MKIYNIKNYFKICILFIIFYFGSSHNNNSVFNKNICKQLNNKYSLSNKNMIYYMCKKNIKQRYNTSAVLSKNILRKYIFIINIVLIYIIYINI
jgi:hypothetical protein